MDAREGFNQWALDRGIRIAVKRIDARPDREADEWDRAAQHFRVTLRRGRRSMCLYYSQGSAHTVEPGIADILSCFQSDFSAVRDVDFETWARDLGYDTDSRKAEATYRAVTRQYEAFLRMLGADWDLDLSALYDLEAL